MALIPQFFTASNKEVAEKALALGHLRYPGICYIKKDDTLAWITKNNEIMYINGDEQITDIRFKDQILSFYCNDKEIFSENISLPENVIEDTKNQILDQINISEYIKTSDLTKVLDSMVGDLKGATSLTEYIDNLNYNDLADIPIENLTGTLINAILVSELDDGVYKINGSYIIGGDYVTVKNSIGTIFLVSHDKENNVSITSLSGNKIETYNINKDGSCNNSQYITEKWVTDNEFIKASEAREYINSVIQSSLSQVVKQEVSEQLFYALDENLGDYISYIDNKEIIRMFNEH